MHDLDTSTPQPSWWRKALGLFSFNRIMTLAGLAVLALYVAAQVESLKVVSTTPAGSLVSVRYSGSSYDPRSVVTTNQGTFQVKGSFPALWGHPLVVESRALGDASLCDPALRYCADLYK